MRIKTKVDQPESLECEHRSPRRSEVGHLDVTIEARNQQERIHSVTGDVHPTRTYSITTEHTEGIFHLFNASAWRCHNRRSQTHSKVKTTRSPFGSSFFSTLILQSIMDMIPSPNYGRCKRLSLNQQ
jgi:hypothetical protein